MSRGPFTKRLLGKDFTCGSGCQDAQVLDFANRDGVTEQRDGFIALPYSEDAWIPWRFQSSALEGSRLVKKGGGYSIHTARVGGLIAWTHANGSVQNINNYFECLLGDAALGLDVAIRLGFDVDLKQGSAIPKLPSAEHFYKPELFLPWIIDKILAFLKDVYGEEVTARQLRVSASNKVFQADQLEFILDQTKKNGVQSYHILVDHLLLRNMEERELHGDNVRAYFSDLSGIVDPGVYSLNRNMRCLGAQKLDKCPLMPLRGVGTLVFADESEFASWRDTPADTVMQHMWTMVPHHARGMDFSRHAAEPAAAERPKKAQTRARGVYEQHLTPLAEEARALFFSFAKQSGIQFDTAQLTWTLRRGDTSDNFDCEVHAEVANAERPCLVRDDSGQPRTHRSNHFKLKVHRDGCVEYICFGSARPFTWLHEVDPVDTSATKGKLKSRLTLGNAHCCAVHLGRLDRPLFELAENVNWVKTTPHGKLDQLKPRVLLDQMQLPRSTVVINRATYGTGKTRHVIEEIIAKLRGNPAARIGYVSSLRTTVMTVMKMINEAIRAAGLDQRLTYYQEKDDKGWTTKAVGPALVGGNIAFVVMSARKVLTDDPGRPFDLLVVDEAEACVRMMESLPSHKGSPLHEMVRILHTANAVRMLDADGDVYCKLLARLAQRGCVTLDAPTCRPFSGAQFTIHGAFRDDCFAYCPQAVLKKLVTLLLGPSVKHAAVACTTVVDVWLVAEALSLSGITPRLCYGKMSDVAKKAFLDGFTSSTAPSEDKSVWVYSPCIGPAVSNTFCDTVCLMWRTQTQTMQDMSQAAWRCRKATQLHAFVMEKQVLSAHLPQARPCGKVVHDACIDGQMLTQIHAKHVPDFVTCALILDEAGIKRPAHSDVNLCDYIYSRSYDNCVDRYVLAPPSELNSVQRAAEQVVLADAGKHHLRTGCTLGEAEQHLVAALPTKWEDVTVDSAPAFVRLRQKMEAMNRARSLLGYFKRALARGGVTLMPADIQLVTKDIAKDCRSWAERIVLARGLRSAADMAAFYNQHIRPRVEVLPSDDFLHEATQALRDHKSDEDCVSASVRRRLANMGEDSRHRYSGLADLPFAPGLLDMLAIAEDAEEGGARDDESPEVDRDAEQSPSEQAIRLAGMRPWVRPLLTFGPEVINATVDDLLQCCKELACSLAAGVDDTDMADVDDGAITADREKYAAVFTKLREFSLLFNTAFVTQHFCKRILVTKALRLSERDTLTRMGIQFVHLERLRTLNDVLGVITDGGRSIVGVHGAEVPYMYTTQKAIDGRKFSQERRARELKRASALSTFSSTFLQVSSQKFKPGGEDDKAKGVLQWALNTMPGTYSVVPKKGIRPALVIRADPLTNRADQGLLEAQKQGVLQDMHDAEVKFWQQLKEDTVGGRPTKRARHDAGHDESDEDT